MEGMQLRSIKLWSKGERCADIYRIIENNTRFPEELMGDIEASSAAVCSAAILRPHSPRNTAS